MQKLVVFLNSTIKGLWIPENGLTKIQMMSFIVQSCLMHEEAYVLTIFLSCLILWLAVLLHHPFPGGSRAVCNSASHCVDEWLLFRENSSAKQEKDTTTQTIPHPNKWVTGRVSCLTACIKGWLSSAEILLPCTFHPKTRISWPQLCLPSSRGYTPAAAAPLGFSHRAKSCFSSHASEERHGGGDQREGLRGGIGLVAEISISIWRAYFRLN